MDFNLTEEQQMLQDTLARLVREQYGFEAREGFYQSEAGFSSAFWQQLAELGLTAVPFDEAHGGFGGGGVDNLVIMTELGRGLCLEPFLQSQIFAGGLLQQLANPDQQEALLPPLVSGELHVAVAFEEPQSHYRLNDVACRAEAVEGGWRISGRKSVVIGGESAGRILLSARTGGEQRDEFGISLFVLDPAAEGVSRRGYPCIDGPRACDLQLENVFVASGARLGEEGRALDALRYQQGRAIAAQCAEALGSMEEVFSLTLDYLKTRKQFGRPIGEFQVLQHRMADICGELEQARSMAIMAACVADEPDSEDRSRRLAAAKYILSRAARFIAEQAIQLHGGIGMTWEYSLSHHAKRLVMLSHQFGDDDHHLDAYAALLEVA
ncbi:acyl-CoA dehydrogenase family protein [Marinobacterium rhizophilum]|uniref:Acyl-CoA dehydrogenase family protein n=1 Tax=Marinobacterium rhizophilum TaxID=420402 RepID=A0ABY5HGG7_9GAMM|nr:acyl-CoA dehydrogenase [Marinobacterium rhizophilum]UTW11457.1 acyl-CoA dehydrogenase family protein [Marinobacterium rhizophilum]